MDNQGIRRTITRSGCNKGSRQDDDKDTHNREVRLNQVFFFAFQRTGINADERIQTAETEQAW